MLLSVVVPAYNEEATILPLLERLLAVPMPGPFEVLVVDDGSRDATGARVESLGDSRVRLLRHDANRGKGAAIRTGLAAARGTWFLVQDADLEYDPGDIPRLLAPALAGEAQVVFGSRILEPGNTFSYHRFYWGGRLVSLWTSLLFGQRITDEPTCYKLAKTEFLRSLDLACQGFEFCPEVTAKTLKRGVRILEIPISYRPRSIAEGKKIRWSDGLVALWWLLKLRLFG
ncbi:MAG: glycosyltransferase family 2 protein [Elusimicrobia bacterium]|nr:glycosyltransferase family 2 protein [Elusimicrobiota bacterium]